MTHERLLELVVQWNAGLALIGVPFVLYEHLAKSASVPDLKAKLDPLCDRILRSVVVEIEETLRPYWPRRASRIIVNPEDDSYDEQPPTVLSDAAKDAIRDCLAENEGLSVRAARIRGLAGKVLRWEGVLYGCSFCTEALALAGLALWWFYDGMSDRVARLAIIVPTSPAVLALMAAAARQIYMHRANDAIIKEEE